MVVKRRYQKKSGEWVEKTYTYKKYDSRRGLTLVSKNGRINYNNVHAFESSIIRNSKFSEAEKETILSDLKARIRMKHKTKRKLTTTGFQSSRIGQGRTKAFFANMGYSTKEFADEIGVSEREVLKKKNWKKGKLIIGDYEYTFTFKYSGAFYEKRSRSNS